MNNKVLLSIIAVLVVVAIGEVWYLSGNNETETAIQAQQAEVVMYKNPGCQCCDKWAAYMEASGFSVAIKPTPHLYEIKKEQNIPLQAASCHTALIEGYVVEGHVPVEDIKRLLKEQPDAVGLAVPGMPQGAPGMPSPNPQPYKVLLIGNDGSLSLYTQH